MKKLNIFLMLALALGFTSCEEEWVEAVPQTNEQEELFTASDFAASNKLVGVNINLNEAATDSLYEVAALDGVSNLPETATIEFAMEMAKAEDFSDAIAVTVTNSANVCYATAGSLQEAYKALQGRNPEAREVYVRYAAYAVDGTAKARVNGIDAYYAASKLTITPVNPGFYVEPAYYLVWSEDPENFDLTDENKVKQLSHSDADVYDDTKFSVVKEISLDEAANGFYWIVVPQSTMDKGTIEGNVVYGVLEEGLMEEVAGDLMGRDADGNLWPGLTFEAGPFQFNFDMYYELDTDGSYSTPRTYEIASAFEYLYTPGNSNGWNHGTANMLFTTDYENYNGYAFLNGEFKFTNAADWNHTNYGNADEEGKLTTDGSAGNLPCEAEGVYWCSVNIPSLTYTKTLITTIGMIGGFNGWSESEAMTAAVTGTTDIKYTGTITTTEATEFKFRANDGWDINLGGEVDNLTPGGANLVLSEAGTYNVVLDLSTVPYTCTITKQ